MRVLRVINLEEANARATARLAHRLFLRACVRPSEGGWRLDQIFSDARAAARSQMRGAGRALFTCIVRTRLCARVLETAKSPPRKDHADVRVHGRREVATRGA